MSALVRPRGPAALRALSAAVAAGGSRPVATECRPELYGYYPDTVAKHASKEQKILLSRFSGDEHYEPKIFRRGPGTPDDPNVVPIRGESRLIACTCDPASHELHYMMVRRGGVEQCPCGFHFKGVDAGQVEFTKELTPTLY